MSDLGPCPCNLAVAYEDCCKPIHSGQRQADTAEALMRSRYSAYVAADIDYLLKTWHPSTRPAAIDPKTIPRWCGLEVIRTEQGGRDDQQGVVEFRAQAMSHDKALVLHELSRFVCEDGRWLYLDGELQGDGGGLKASKVGRNSPCPCGSGKKFKKCCGP
ncbi:YchJ family protein [Desulfogranum mediterraneum]|uniref:YchJ family protein n=1 Tax=Desulfogranum mediterraneum TaxID=160661 RepID=UPI00041B61A7|nr:YchJ family protein [Desulfogranum mediterraneum]